MRKKPCARNRYGDPRITDDPAIQDSLAEHGKTSVNDEHTGSIISDSTGSGRHKPRVELNSPYLPWPKPMNITTFDELLSAARGQSEPQRLLFVFAGAELGADATAQERAAFDAGHAGELAPLMCVDKSADELAGFDTLADQARSAGPPWAIVFAAAIPDSSDETRNKAVAEETLQRMVLRIQQGDLAGMIPFDTTGQAVTL